MAAITFRRSLAAEVDRRVAEDSGEGAEGEIMSQRGRGHCGGEGDQSSGKMRLAVDAKDCIAGE